MTQGNLLGLGELVGRDTGLFDLFKDFQDELLCRFPLRRLNRCVYSE